ncbi:MAG: tetratricopeptide repeat protein [Polyangiaceae bacterium]|nr:tetratricopeptide repeat protein [Polyangiaceae bacterium]
MLRKTGLLVLLALTVPSLAQAQAKPQKPTGTQPGADGVRRDPQGIKGISPFWESVKKGDDLYVARDFDGAIAAFKDAIVKDPQNAMGHYRIGEAHRAKNELKEAEAAWVAALRYVGSDKPLKAKILFVLADLRERQKSFDDANDRWNAYLEFGKQNPDTKIYAASAEERKKRIATWKQLLEQYGAVRKRIEARLKEADAKAKASAK